MRVLFLVVLVISACCKALGGNAKLCHKLIGYLGCTNYAAIRIELYSNVWSGLRCKSICLQTSRCETYIISEGGTCAVYPKGCALQANPLLQQFDLIECNTIVGTSYNALVDEWDEQFDDLASLKQWYTQGGHFAPPYETNFINVTFPYQVVHYEKKVLRLQTFYKCAADTTVTLKANNWPAGLFTYVSLLDNRTIVLPATTKEQDGSFSVDDEIRCKEKSTIKLAVLVATQPGQLKITLLIRKPNTTEKNYELINSSLAYVNSQKPYIFMNEDRVIEVVNELVPLKPSIIGYLPITGYWIFNGIRVSDTPCALLIDTRNSSTYGLYKLYAENIFGTASFHVLVKPPFEEPVTIKRFTNASLPRMQSVEIVHRFSGQDLRSVAMLSETNTWIASLSDARMTSSNNGKLMILRSNFNRFCGLTSSADMEFETSAAISSWSDIWYKTTYNYSLLANGNGYHGGIILFSTAVADSALWVYEVNTSISENMKKANGKVSVVFEDKALNARQGKYPHRMPFNVAVKVELEEGSSGPLYGVSLAVQVPVRLIDILYVNPNSTSCACRSDVHLSSGMVTSHKDTLNFEEEIQIQLTMIAYRDTTIEVPMWITYAFRTTNAPEPPAIYYRQAQVYIGNEINLALRKVATQSSVYPGAMTTADRAVDGNVNSDMQAGSCTSTGGQAKPWWQVYLDYPSWVKKVIIYNRMDGSSERLSGAIVTIGSDPTDVKSMVCGQVGSMMGVAVTTIECPKPLMGTYVRISIAFGYLALCEVQVIGSHIEGEVNLALGKLATQSSVHPYASTLTAGNAVDGNANTESLCAHTNVELNPWWQVDLDYRSFIRRVIVQTTMECCTECMNNVMVSVGYDPTGATNDLCGTVQNMTGTNATVVQCPKKLEGRYIRLFVAFGILKVCEVQAIGSYFEDEKVLKAFSVSYVMPESGTVFFACCQVPERRDSLCLMTDNQGRSWKVLPSTIYSILAYDNDNGLLVTIDAQQRFVYVDVKTQPWKVYLGAQQNVRTMIPATYVNETQAYQNELGKVTIKVGSQRWMFTRDGIKEGDYYILRW